MKQKMAFKVPTLLPAKATTNVDTRGLPTFNWRDVKNKDIIGQGSFGVVFTAEHNSKISSFVLESDGHDAQVRVL